MAIARRHGESLFGQNIEAINLAVFLPELQGPYGCIGNKDGTPPGVAANDYWGGAEIDHADRARTVHHFQPNLAEGRLHDGHHEPKS